MQKRYFKGYAGSCNKNALDEGVEILRVVSGYQNLKDLFSEQDEI
jgi:hypothetical protein